MSPIKGFSKKTAKTAASKTTSKAARTATGDPVKVSGKGTLKSLSIKDISRPVVGIVMGSKSDYETLKATEDVLREFSVAYEISVVSAHRTPEVMFGYARSAHDRGLKIIIAGAGGAAHLPGMVAALTILPVLGVPVQSKALSGLDSLLSIVQMPAGIPTATFAIGQSGATNAGLFAVQMLALDSGGLSTQLLAYREKIAKAALAGNDEVQARALSGSSTDSLKGKGVKR